VLALRVEDPLERELPSVGWLVCEDAETGQLAEVNTTSVAARHAFEVARRERSASLRDAFRRAGVDHATCEVGHPVYRAVLELVEMRRGRPGAGMHAGASASAA
jgi:uncharacterized protein (DUF58 family)